MTKKEKRVYDFIKGYEIAHGHRPSYIVMSSVLGLSKPDLGSTINYIRNKGFLPKQRRRIRRHYIKNSFLEKWGLSGEPIEKEVDVVLAEKRVNGKPIMEKVKSTKTVTAEQLSWLIFISTMCIILLVVVINLI